MEKIRKNIVARSASLIELALKKGGSRKSEISIVEGLDSLAKRGTFSFARLLPHDVA